MSSYIVTTYPVLSVTSTINLTQYSDSFPTPYSVSSMPLPHTHYSLSSPAMPPPHTHYSLSSPTMPPPHTHYSLSSPTMPPPHTQYSLSSPEMPPPRTQGMILHPSASLTPTYVECSMVPQHCILCHIYTEEIIWSCKCVHGPQ